MYEDTAYGSTAWVSPNSVMASDDVFASNTNPQDAKSLRCSNFSFNVPTGATINGVECRVYRYSSGVNAVKDFEIMLSWGGSRGGTNKANLADYWPTSEVAVTYGGAADKWNVALMYTDVNNYLFGVYVRPYKPGGAGYAYIDYIEMRVNYT